MSKRAREDTSEMTLLYALHHLRVALDGWATRTVPEPDARRSTDSAVHEVIAAARRVDLDDGLRRLLEVILQKIRAEDVAEAHQYLVDAMHHIAAMGYAQRERGVATSRDARGALAARAAERRRSRGDA